MNNVCATLRSVVACIAFAMPLCINAQVKVNYDALPDYDYRPPVKDELGIPGANALHSKNAAKSNAFKAASFSLPDHWNNALTKHFPPFFYQSGPSCMCSSFTGYIFTHELNSLRDLEGENPENQMAIFFGWLQTYMNSSKEDIERDNGCPNSVDYGGRTNSSTLGYYTWRDNNSGWMQGYDKWHRAMFNRAEGFYTFPQTLAKEEGRQALKHWLYNHNGDTDFKSGGLCYVTLAATGMSYTKIPETPANSEAGVVGKQYIQKWGTEIDHAMTVIGWDDRIEFDFNNNGVYGEDSEDEKGAWIVANSWGALWCNGGWIYVPYRYAGPIGKVTGNLFWQPYVTYVRKNVFPTRTIKLLMEYSRRNELRLSVGVNPDINATKPLFSVDMTSFKNAGNGSEEGGYPEVPMLGQWVDGMHHEPMEFGYDLTDISNGYDPSQPLKYFFTVKVSNGLGTGYIRKASIMDYRYETEEGTEIPFGIEDVLIGKGAESSSTTISVVVPGEAVNPPVNATVTQMDNSDDFMLKWDAPTATSLKINKYYIYRYNELVDSVAATAKSYNVGNSVSNYSVSAVYGYKTRQIESSKSNIAYCSSIDLSGDNKSLVITDGCLKIPNAIPDRMTEGTIEFMMKPGTIGKDTYRLSGTGKDKFFFEITPSGQAVAGWNDDNKAASAAKIVKANTWQHIAIVVKNNVVTLYINGMKKGSFSSTTNSGIPGLGDLVFGDTDNPLNVELDEFRVWRKARSQAEIYSGKDNPIAKPSAQTDLIAYLPMNLLSQSLVQEYIFNNHALLLCGSMESKTNTDILKGSSFSLSPTITANDTLYVGQPSQLCGVGGTNIVSWKWNTPGATTETYSIQSPVVTYATPGTYTVTLATVDNKNKDLSATKEIVVVKDKLADVDFDMSATRIAVGQTCSFVNRTSGNGCSYYWFIEGQSDKYYSTNFSTVFNTPGTYKVTLVAVNSTGTAMMTKDVEVYEARPSSKFNVAPNEILLGEKTYLEDKSLGSPTSWLWTLTNGKRYLQVDGQFSSLVPPAPGFYDVSLQTTNEVGANRVTMSKALCVSNADAKNGLAFAGNREQLQLNRPFSADESAFTIEWWMNPVTYAGAGAFKFGDLSTECDEKGTYYLNYKDLSVWTNTPVTNQWHHYAVVFDHGKVYAYRDAVLMGTVNGTSKYTTPSWPDIFNYGSADIQANCYIDEMRFWKGAMTPEQLKQVCNSPVENPAETENLCAYYDFNQNGGSVIDRTGRGNDAKRINFGPDGDAWIITPGVFTLDFGGDVTETDVTDKYLTNYKAPFLSNDTQVTPQRKGAKELLTENEKSTWVFKTPRIIDDNSISTVYVDSINKGYMAMCTYYDLGNMYNQALYQTVTLPQGHYKFSVIPGNVFAPQNSRLVVCHGEKFVTNETIDDALNNCMLTSSKDIEFDVADDNTNITLGILVNMSDYNKSTMFIKSFKLTQVAASSQTADGINDAYDAVNKGSLDNFSGERGAIRLVSDKTIEVKIYNEQGQCLFNEYFSGNKRIPVVPGVYVVNGVKVLVK